MTRRVFEIVQRSRAAAGRGSAATEAKRQARVTKLYRDVMTITRAVVRKAESVGQQLAGRRAGAVKKLRQRLEATSGLVRRVLTQTRARILGGETHHPKKVLSIFEPHTEVIRKGKAAKPTEFGKVVKIQEADGQIITDYQVCSSRVPDDELWTPGLDRHCELFGRLPRLAVADAGFASPANERAALDRGVTRVVLPRRPGPRNVLLAVSGSPRAVLAHRLRRTNQCDQALSWPSALSVPRALGNGALGRARSDRQQSADAGASGPIATKEAGMSAANGRRWGVGRSTTNLSTALPMSWLLPITFAPGSS